MRCFVGYDSIVVRQSTLWCWYVWKIYSIHSEQVFSVLFLFVLCWWCVRTMMYCSVAVRWCDGDLTWWHWAHWVMVWYSHCIHRVDDMYIPLFHFFSVTLLAPVHLIRVLMWPWWRRRDLLPSIERGPALNYCYWYSVLAVSTWYNCCSFSLIYMIPFIDYCAVPFRVRRPSRYLKLRDGMSIWLSVEDDLILIFHRSALRDDILLDILFCEVFGIVISTVPLNILMMWLILCRPDTWREWYRYIVVMAWLAADHSLRYSFIEIQAEVCM
jgi:hypothetical protein